MAYCRNTNFFTIHIKEHALMANNFVFNDSLPVAPLKIAALESCKELAGMVNDHIVRFRRNDMEELMRDVYKRQAQKFGQQSQDDGGDNGAADVADTAQHHVHQNHDGHVVAKTLRRGR